MTRTIVSPRPAGEPRGLVPSGVLRNRRGCGGISPVLRSVPRRTSREGAMPRTIEERFWSRVDLSGGPEACWPWAGFTNKRGYGIIRINERNQRTHRVAYALVCGPILNGLCVLHRCDNPPCVNPAHLFLGTQADNVADMTRKGRRRGKPSATHCLRGHTLAPGNLIRWKARPHHRDCLTCHRERMRRRRSCQ